MLQSVLLDYSTLKFLVKSENTEEPRYVFFSIILLLSFSLVKIFSWELHSTLTFASLVTTSHEPNGKHSLYYLRSLFNMPLPSNELTIVVKRISLEVITGPCLAIDMRYNI
jgi:hypothetical protein